ncbi:MAG: hypothetical protein R3C59_25240 [Planctomycetaceae bacterium]
MTLNAVSAEVSHRRRPRVGGFTATLHSGIWDESGTIDTIPVSPDLNDDGFPGDLLATPNQWNSIIDHGGSIGSIDTLEGALKFAESVLEPFPYVELTEEMNQKLTQ